MRSDDVFSDHFPPNSTCSKELFSRCVASTSDTLTKPGPAGRTPNASGRESFQNFNPKGRCVFKIETPNSSRKSLKIHNKCSIHFLRNYGLLWSLLRKSIPLRSRTSLAQGSFLGSTEGSLRNVRRRQRRPHWEAGPLTNSRL